MSYEYLVYLLVFIAAVAVIKIVIDTVQAVGLAEGENIDFESNFLTADGKQKKPLERFVSPGKLFKLQLAAAVLPGISVPVAFLLCGFTSPVFLLCFGAVFGLVGWRIPKFYYQIRVKRRQLEFEGKILDLTMGLANALKSGMALPQALERISERMSGAMKQELMIFQRDYRLHIPLGDALERLTERMPCEDMHLLTSAIRLTTQTGGSLSDVLQEMVEMIRGRMEFKDKLRTLTTQGKFEGAVLSLAPIFAFVIFYFVQPDFMTPLFKTTTGWCALGVAGVFELLGFICIRRITAIEV